jgi:hypothetical protein
MTMMVKAVQYANMISLPVYSTNPTKNYKNTCIIPDRTDESGWYAPKTGMEMVAKSCFDINPTSNNCPDRDGTWIHSNWKELKS